MKRFAFLMCLALLSIAPTQASAEQEIRPFVRGSYQQIVAARQGRPFIVSFWSLTCSYCMVEMAMLKKLVKKYPHLDLVMISTDAMEDQPAVSATLAKFSLNKTDAWLFADSYADRLRFEVDKTWQGELPRSYFFTAKNEVKAISGKLEREAMERWIKQQYAF
jgi:thiol-disulfide isomerase/thioredoxin